MVKSSEQSRWEVFWRSVVAILISAKFTYRSYTEFSVPHLNALMEASELRPSKTDDEM